MGRSNRLAANQLKIAYLLGEKEDVIASIRHAEGLIAVLPQWRDRLCQIELLIDSGSTFIKDDHPEWSIQNIVPIRKWIHKGPIALGQLSKGALGVLRTSPAPLTCRQVASLLLAKTGVSKPEPSEVDQVANSVQAAFAKRRGSLLKAEGDWPERWSVRRQADD